MSTDDLLPTSTTAATDDDPLVTVTTPTLVQRREKLLKAAREMSTDDDDDPLVTVITPTLVQRREKLLKAVASVQAQTFTRWEHLIIHNQRPPIAKAVYGERRVRNVFLGRPHGTPGHWNRVLGGLLARTPYVSYCDDDNTWRPRHLEVLVNALQENPHAGFAYARMAYTNGRELGDPDLEITGAVNHIDASMFVHRTELLSEIATWDPLTAPPQLRYAMDGFLVQQWLNAGIGYVHIPEVTVDYSGVGYYLDGGGAPAEVVSAANR